jgi:LmbE family N-acetylglucosaminyl deacetylase
MDIFGRRILVLIPHPDDEVVGCAVAIARARATGAQVFGLYLSHGCLPRSALWPWQRHGYRQRAKRRREEGGRAAIHLGLSLVGENVRRAAREIWPNLEEAMVEVRTAMSHCRPDRIWVPAYEGGNPDHDAVNALASTIIETPVYEFSEYNFVGGRPRFNAFVHECGEASVLRLAPEEQAMKRRAIKIYASERANLSGLTCEQEVFRRLPAYDYSKPPHEGTLWYARFQWVPFRHPRVDDTKPQEVSAAITRFLADASLRPKLGHEGNHRS